MIVLGTSMFLLPIVCTNMEIIKNDEIINNEFVLKKSDSKEDTLDNELSYEYEGYLEVPKYNIKRLIKKGVTEEVLSKNYVLYYNSFVSLDKNDFNIILLGHNIESVFRFLHYLDVGDEVVLVTHKFCYKFEIYSVNIISEREVSILNESHDEKVLTLITCMKNNKNRLVLRAKLKNM